MWTSKLDISKQLPAILGLPALSSDEKWPYVHDNFSSLKQQVLTINIHKENVNDVLGRLGLKLVCLNLILLKNIITLNYNMGNEMNSA